MTCPESDSPVQALADDEPVLCRLDSRNIIIDVGGGWDTAAREGDAPQLVAKSVLGRSIEQFISGDAARMFVRTVLSSSRLLDRVVMRPYRCDSPFVRRYMQMEVVPDARGELLIAHRVIRTVPMHAPIWFSTASGAAPPHAVRCSMCNRIKHDARWSEPDEFIGPSHLSVIYGVCPDCLDTLKRRHEPDSKR